MGCIVVAPPAIFLPSGMTKNGTAPVNTTYAQIPAWIADPTYPGSTVSSDSLVVQGASNSATVAANIPWTSSFSGAMTLRLFLGATQIAQGAASATGTSGTAVVSATGVTVNPGDLLSVWAVYSVSFGATVTAGTGTWLRVT